MDSRLIIFVLAGALMSVTSAQSYHYYFGKINKTWTEAQSFCRLTFVDLATLQHSGDVDAVNSLTSDYTGKAWIGLHDDVLDSWRWSLINSSFYDIGGTEFRNWRYGQPSNHSEERCVVLFGNYSGTWGDDFCYEQHRFVCYNGLVNGSVSLVMVNRTLSWNSAQNYCRVNYIDLVSIRNHTENDLVTRISGEDVWIGLYRQKVWSDGSVSLFRNWASGQPNPAGKECITTSFSDAGRWSEDSCSDRYPFICYTPIQNFTLIAQSETHINLQWYKVDVNDFFLLLFNGTLTNISASVGNGPVNHTVSSLTPASRYSFTLFISYNGFVSSGASIIAATAPQNTNSFTSTAQNETSITLQWNEINNNIYFKLYVDGIRRAIVAPVGGGAVTHTVSSLTAASKYTFTLVSVFEGISSSGISITAVTAPENAVNLTTAGQDETSINLQWNKVNSNTSFILQFDGTETNISAPVGGGAVTHTVSSLTAGSKYTFTVFSVFENVRSSGISITAVTAPPNPQAFSYTANETSITLQWNKINNNISFILQFNGAETTFSAPVGDGAVTHTISSLTVGSPYIFFLFSVFENVRSSGISMVAFTGPNYVVGLNIRIESNEVLSELQMTSLMEEVFRQYGIPVSSSVRVLSVEPET